MRRIGRRQLSLSATVLTSRGLSGDGKRRTDAAVPPPQATRLNTLGAAPRRPSQPASSFKTAPAPGDVVSRAAQQAAEALGVDVEGQTEARDKPPGVAPPIYRVPTQVPRVVGRERHQLQLWQSMLSGKKTQLIIGVDGIGKSSLAAEFAEACRRSQRYSCIAWFDASDAERLRTELGQYIRSLKGRSEKEALLVFDNALDVFALEKYIPVHEKLTVVVTSPQLGSPAAFEHSLLLHRHRLNVFACPPLEPDQSIQLFPGPEALEETDARRLAQLLGNVPLLLHVAGALLSGEKPIEAAVLLDTLEAASNRLVGDAVSVSATLPILVDLALDNLRDLCGPEAADALATLSLFDISNIEPAIVEGMGEQPTSPLAPAAVQLGLLLPKLDDAAGGWQMHPSVAAVLRSRVKPGASPRCASLLLEMWPRRMGSQGTLVVQGLIRHLRSLSRTAHCAALLPLYRKGADFLLHDGSDWTAARELLGALRKFGTEMERRERYASLRDLGLLLCSAKLPEAEAVLREALRESNSEFGEASLESASLVAAMCSYLPATAESLREVHRAATVLQRHTAEGGSGPNGEPLVFSAEEAEVHRRNLFCLLVKSAQLSEALEQPIPSALWDRISQLQRTIESSVH